MEAEWKLPSLKDKASDLSPPREPGTARLAGRRAAGGCCAPMWPSGCPPGEVGVETVSVLRGVTAVPFTWNRLWECLL